MIPRLKKCWIIALIVTFLGGCLDNEPLTPPLFICISERMSSSRKEIHRKILVCDMTGKARATSIGEELHLSWDWFIPPTFAVQLLPMNRFFYNTVDGVYEYDILRDTKLLIIPPEQGKGGVVDFYLFENNENMLLIRHWQPIKKLILRNMQTGEEDLLIEGKQGYNLHRNPVSPSGRFLWVRDYNRKSRKYILRFFDRELKREILNIESTECFSIGWNPWGARDNFYVSRSNGSRWEALEVNLPLRTTRSIGDQLSNCTTPCSWNDNIVVVESNPKESRVAVYDASGDLQMHLPQVSSRCFNPITFPAEDFILYASDEGGNQKTLLFKEGMKTPVTLAETIDPRPDYNEKENLLLLCEIEHIDYAELKPDELKVVYPYGMKAVDRPAKVYVINLKDFSRKEVFDDSLLAFWVR